MPGALNISIATHCPLMVHLLACLAASYLNSPQAGQSSEWLRRCLKILIASLVTVGRRANVVSISLSPSRLRAQRAALLTPDASPRRAQLEVETKGVCKGYMAGGRLVPGDLLGMGAGTNRQGTRASSHHFRASSIDTIATIVL